MFVYKCFKITYAKFYYINYSYKNLEQINILFIYWTIDFYIAIYLYVNNLECIKYLLTRILRN